MTTNQFAALCGELLIDPGVALENENVRAALLARKSAREIRAIRCRVKPSNKRGESCRIFNPLNPSRVFMKTRRSWRNQNRLWKMLGNGDFQTVTSGNAPKPKAKPPLEILTDAEVDAMWWISKTSRSLMKRDYAKRRIQKVAQ